MRTARVPVGCLGLQQTEALFTLMQLYYSGVSRAEFVADLNEKDEVILLMTPQKEIVGFSTLKKSFVTVSGKKVLALFSGDTVLEKNYWGNGALGLAFGAYLFEQKLRHPFTPLYWFLMSKGYKTYLLMANNFPVHYPRYEKETPDFQKALMNEFYSSRYPTTYFAESSLIKTPTRGCTLKPDVAQIDRDMLNTHQRIKFFAQTNPDWSDGAELACIARVDLFIPIVYVIKRLLRKKRHSKKRLSNSVQETRDYAASGQTVDEKPLRIV